MAEIRAIKMISRDQSLRFAPDVVLQVIDAEAVLLRLDDEVVFSLNESGARIAELVGEGHAIDEVIRMLCEEYGASAAAVEPDVMELVEQLLSRGLLTAAPTIRKGQ